VYVCTIAVTFAKLMTKLLIFKRKFTLLSEVSTLKSSMNKIYKCWKKKKSKCFKM